MYDLNSLHLFLDIVESNTSKRIRLQPSNGADHNPESFHLDARLEPTCK